VKLEHANIGPQCDKLFDRFATVSGLADYLYMGTPRNNRDWHHLIDLCAMAGTLVIDHDGIYDPSCSTTGFYLVSRAP